MRKSEATRFQFTADEAESEIAATKILAEIKANKSVYVTGATITGPLPLSYDVIKGELALLKCELTEAVSAENATFERAVAFDGTHFNGGASFVGTVFKGIVSFDECEFRKASFIAAVFAQGVSFSRAHFMPNANKSIPANSEDNSVSFSWSKVQLFMTLSEAVIEGGLDCRDTEVIGTFLCKALRCKNEASFRGLTAHDEANFKSAIFEASADFSHMKLHGDLVIEDAQFLEATSAEDETVNNFVGTVIEGDLKMAGGLFEGNTSMQSMHVQGTTIISQSLPGLPKELQKASHFRANVDFSDSHFSGPFNFLGGEVSGQALFEDVEFMDRAFFTACFNSATKEVRFDRAKFAGPAVFEAVFKGGMSSFGAWFNDYVAFRGDCCISSMTRELKNFGPFSQRSGRIS